MSRRPSVDDQGAIALEAWYCEYERVGTVGAKCRQLGITPHTLYDAIRRVRGFDTRPLRRKLSALEIDNMAREILAGTNDVSHETAQSLEQREDIGADD